MLNLNLFPIYLLKLIIVHNMNNDKVNKGCCRNLLKIQVKI